MARGERESDVVKAALATEMRKIFERAAIHDGNHYHGTSRVAVKNGKACKSKKEAVNRTLASVKDEMAHRRAEAARN